MGNASEACRLADRAAAADPGNAEAWFVLSSAQRAAGRFSDAEASLGRAAQLIGPQNIQIRLATAILRRAQGRRDEAIQVIRGVLEQEPGLADAQALWLGYAQEDGRLREAQRELAALNARAAR